jgi:excisionase family DNA binding protein
MTARTDHRQVSRPEILSAPEAARILGVHPNTLYKLIHAGSIPAFRLATGGRWRLKRTTVLEWLQDKEAQGSV